MYRNPSTITEPTAKVPEWMFIRRRRLLDKWHKHDGLIQAAIGLELIRLQRRIAKEQIR